MHKTLILILLFPIFLSACSTQQTLWRQQLDENSLPKNWQQVSQSEQAQSISYLLDLVNIPQLDILVEKALINSPSINRTLITLKSARISLDRTEGDQLPSVSLSNNAQKREENTGGSSKSYSSKVSVSWEVDLWSRLSDKTKAASFDKAVNEQDYQAARDSLAGQVIKSYLNLIATAQRVQVQQLRVKSLLNNQNIIKQRYRSGLSSLDDLETIRSSYANEMANLVQLEESQIQDKRTLAVLVGDQAALSSPSVLFSLVAQLPEVILPLAEIPIKTIQRRPDISAALLRIEAEDARTSATYKDMLPSFSLSGDLEASDVSASAMLLKDPLWSLLGSLTSTLYNGGKLKANAKLQELTAESAYWSYRDALLNAVQEVENALGSESSLLKQQTYHSQALESSKISENNYQSRYRQGLVDILELLQAQRSRFDTENNLIQTQVKLLNNRIDLGLALGLGVK